MAMKDPVLSNIKETQRQIFVDFALNSLRKLLPGNVKVHHQQIVNSAGYEAKRIIITYDQVKEHENFSI